MGVSHNYKYRIEKYYKKKSGVLKTPDLYYPKITNYAATAGATRATGRDSPAARSRGKL